MTLLEQLEEVVEAMNRLVAQLRNDGHYPAADRWIVRTRVVEEAVEKLKGAQEESRQLDDAQRLLRGHGGGGL